MPRSIVLPPFVMPGLGPIGVGKRDGAEAPLHPHPSRHARPWAWHPRVCMRRRADRRRRESDPVSLDEPFLRNSWMPGPSPIGVRLRLSRLWDGLEGPAPWRFTELSPAVSKDICDLGESEGRPDGGA